MGQREVLTVHAFFRPVMILSKSVLTCYLLETFDKRMHFKALTAIRDFTRNNPLF